MAESEADAQVLLVVPRDLVKTIKDAFQHQSRLDKSKKIEPLRANEAAMRVYSRLETKSCEEKYLIPTTMKARTGAGEEEILMLKRTLLDMNNVSQYMCTINIYLRKISSSDPSLPTPEPAQATSLVGQVVRTWLLSLPSCILPLPIPSLISLSPWSYTVYHPLLLLPQNTFASPPWQDLISTSLRPHLPQLYKLLCTHLKTTHIALNAPISELIPGTPNILRKPKNFIPLHGSFGPSLPPTHTPGRADFAAAFWCSVRQNGIFQTWAPRHTMFSRGNISEKTRLLGLKTLTEGGLGGLAPGATSAVDLYAGIGYFAFCYAKLGVSKILCWELSGWSVEGLRRGAAGNGWDSEVFDADAGDTENAGAKLVHEEMKFLVFQEDNRKAAQRISALRSHIPPIRHVNCGFLPTSQGSWETAVRALDPDLGGWIHAHENIEKVAFEKRRDEIVGQFRDLVWKWKGGGGAARSQYSEKNMGDSLQHSLAAAEAEVEPEVKVDAEAQTHTQQPVKDGEAQNEMIVECVDFEQVKSYAPGIMHCVLDIAVLPRHAK